MTDAATARSVSLTTDLDHQFEQASELRKLSYKIIVVEGLRDLTMAQRVALAMFYRSLQTHEAIEILLKQKLVEDAQALVRVLVEHMVNCAYMLMVADEETAADFVKHPRYRNYFILRDLKAVDETRFRNQFSVKLEHEILREYEALLPRFQNRPREEWCVDGKLHKRAAKVDESLAEFVNAPYIEFRWLVNSSWRLNSSHVHGNADVLLEQVSHSENVMTIEQKFDAEDAAGALYIANFGLSLVLKLIDGLVFKAENGSAVLDRVKKFIGNI